MVPYSCSAWIHAIHSGIDVARAAGLDHIAGATGSTSEAAVQALYGLPEIALIDMGDFVGGMLKYLRRHPVARVTIAGGVGKLTKLAQGLLDLHSRRGAVDLAALAALATAAGGSDALRERIVGSNTAAEAFAHAAADGVALGDAVARAARETARWWSRAAASPSRSRCSTATASSPAVRRSDRITPAPRREAATVVGIVKRAVAEIPCGERAADHDQRRALDRRGRDPRDDVAEGAAHDAFLRPACPRHDRRRAVGTVDRHQLGDDPVERCDREMNRKRRTGRGKGGELFAERHRRGSPRHAGEHDALRHLRHGQFAMKRGSGRREGRHARREGKRNAAAFEPAQLFGERAVDRKIAGLQPRHVMAGGMGRHEFRLDLVERHRRGVDDARARGQ